jgi:hypothetical protein
MAHDWLLVETLGDEPVVVALGTQLKQMVPLHTFLRRSAYSVVIAAAVQRTVWTGEGIKETLEGTDRAIRTEPVVMTDARVHGVQVWSGPASQEPPSRPTVGPAVWDITSGVAIPTPASQANKGIDPDSLPKHGRSFADELPRKGLHRGETQILAMAITSQPGEAFCGCWEGCNALGEPVPYGWVARSVWEPAADGQDHHLFRSMNWRCVASCSNTVTPDDLAQRILDGLAQPGTHRALVSLENWTLLKWLDEPCPYFDWRPSGDPADPLVHPDDEPVIVAMTTDFEKGPASGVLRFRGLGGGWAPIHLTVNRFELDTNAIVGLVSLRLPTAAELTGD